MKIVLVILIIAGFGIAGYLYKQRFVKQLKALEMLKDYCNYFKDNLLLFKNNIEEININYIITQKNKTAKQEIIIKNNVQKYQINYNFLQKNIYNKSLYITTEKYFQTQGTNEYDYETSKIKDYIEVLERELKNTEIDSKNKGDLYFKLLLAVGVVLSILIW